MGKDLKGKRINLFEHEMKEGNELSELLSSFFVRKMKSVILRYFINWFIDVQYSVVIMYKERRCYNASNQTNYRFT